MKNKSLFSMTILVLGGLAWFGLPWWWLAVAGFVAGLAFKNSVGAVFGLGSAAGTLLWSSTAFYLNYLNGEGLSGMMAGLASGLTASKLSWATAVLGGVLAGFGALSGCLLRRIFLPNELVVAEKTAA